MVMLQGSVVEFWRTYHIWNHLVVKGRSFPIPAFHPVNKARCRYLSIYNRFYTPVNNEVPESRHSIIGRSSMNNVRSIYIMGAEISQTELCFSYGCLQHCNYSVSLWSEQRLDAAVRKTRALNKQSHPKGTRPCLLTLVQLMLCAKEVLLW